MPKSVHMHVKNFTCIASIMHVKFEVHMHDKIVSHVWKDFTCNKKFTHDKIFSHVLQNFTRMSKSSHACEMLMCWTCVFANIDFTWFLSFTPFSHPFHMIFTHIALVVRAAMKFSCFSSNEEDFCLPSSFSVIHVSVNIKNNIEKLTTLFFLPLQKSGWPCDFLPLHLGCQTCWLSYFILVCQSCRWTVGHSGGVCSRDYQIF